jgi:hypothetical protein
MKKHAVFGIVLAATVALFATATPALATPITQTINLGEVYTGYTPYGPAPWLTATFTYDPGSTTGTLVLMSNLSSSGFVQGANGVTGWGFYLNGNSVSGVSCATGVCANSVSTSSLNSGPVPGGFDLGFGWISQNRFDGSDSATYTLLFDSALTSSPFVANGSGWLSYAHVQGLAPNGCSGFIVSGSGAVNSPEGLCDGSTPPITTTNVAEPGALGMFGLGAFLIGGFLGWRRRYA